MSATRRFKDAHADRGLLCLLRYPAAWAKAYMDHLEFDCTLIEPGELFVADHSQHDCWVLYNGKQIRPWITAIQDARSRCIVGWHIVHRLTGSHRLLIVDEAHKIHESALEWLRELHDGSGLPMLFLATKDLRERIRRDADEDHGQVYSRVGYFCDLTRGRDKSPGGSRPLYTIGEIVKMFEQGGVKLAADAREHLQDVANMLGHGSLRRVRWIVRCAAAFERVRQGLDRKAPVTVTAAACRAAETEPMDDDSLTADIAARGLVRTA